MSPRRIGGIPDAPPEAGEHERRTSAPIFIFGAMERSGTNYLTDLLALHPDLAWPELPGEDFLLFNLPLLDDYVDATVQRWGKWGRHTPAARAEFVQHIGLGLLNFMWSRVPDQRVVVKTPRADHAHRFFDVFPHGLPIGLVRDGRASAESGRRSFGWPIARSAKRWAQGVRDLARLAEVAESLGAPYLQVAYEDIYPDPEPWLRAAFVHLGIDATTFPFDEVADLPFRGSSTERGGTGTVHWEKIERPHDFAPHERWHGWSAEDHAAFNEHAAAELVLLGYEPR